MNLDVGTSTFPHVVAFLQLQQKHKVMAETYLHRLSQVLPGRLGIRELYLLRFIVGVLTVSG